MKEKIPRRKFTAEFKKESIELVERSSKPSSEIAHDLGIRPELLYRWKREYKLKREQAFPGTGHLHNSGDESVRKLERELRSVQEERDILKKALAIFSKVPR